MVIVSRFIVTTPTIPGSRHYIHADDVASVVLFLLGKDIIERNYGGAKCPKFNIVGEELNNLELVKSSQMHKVVNSTMNWLISTLLVLDMIFAMFDGDKMKTMGWTPVNQCGNGFE